MLGPTVWRLGSFLSALLQFPQVVAKDCSFHTLFSAAGLSSSSIPIIGTEGNFEIANPNFVTTQGVPYDIRSIMHYSATAFSINRLPTIEPIDPNIPLSQLGQRQGFTELDLQHVRTLYCGGGQSIILVLNTIRIRAE